MSPPTLTREGTRNHIQLLVLEVVIQLLVLGVVIQLLVLGVVIQLLVLGVFIFETASLLWAPHGSSWSLPPLRIEVEPSHAATDFSAVAPFIFDSVHGLLKQWPNSYAPNGHSIVAGTVPANTALYHASAQSSRLSKTAFFAFDAEMSVGIYGGAGQSSLHVYGTTRPLNVIYFDGQSATLTPAGTLDSQMVVLQGNVPLYPSYNLVYDDHQRALDFCRLAADLGIDGMVRMNAGFEVLVCDFDASQVRELFITNNSVPNPEAENKSLPHDPNRQPPRGYGNVFAEQGSFEWLRSATWHYGGYGGNGGLAEPRIKLDLCRMVSFYDPALPSLAGAHHGGVVGNQTYENGWGLRRGHRLLEIDEDDVELVRTWLKDMASPSSGARCSGVDWHAIFTAIQDQHGTRAREIAAVFEWDRGTEEEQNAIITRVHELSHAVLSVYVEYSSKTPKEVAIARCSSVYTMLVDPSTLGRPERLLYGAVETVLKKLCSWEWDLFEWSEGHTSNYLGKKSKYGITARETLLDEINEYRRRTTEVLTWMGWDTWTQCERQCGPTELCAIPTWPVVYAPGLPQGGIYAGSNPRLTDEETREFWRPKCVNRTDFDRGGGRGREPNHQLPDVPPY
ncbi:hypothetical protein C8A00DRAFT_12870 [Chaetomidium leptoderma]|uniref:Uncharacterized protein n=1 Tax=Chaetomidium leptoderma TaxID=669021 RepID=A0AAN6VR05_9PEZI|nr:hypothetical protein C8A00DRAFT_12870 [Chaetomidium leptoderma]